MSLTRTGYVLSTRTYPPDTKKELTVRAVENALGMRPPVFKVYRETARHLCVPRFYGQDKFGPALRDTRPEPIRVNIHFTGQLRDATRQNEAFRAGVEAFQTHGGGVLSLPPGYGKTACALAFAGHLGVRTLIVVHKEFLANQWKERIEQFCPGASIGRIQQDVFDVEKDFVIAMIQTLCSRENAIGAFDSFGLVIVDEAHHIGAAAFSQSMFKFFPKYTLGLTATPERKDGLTRILYWFMGPEFFSVRRKDQTGVQVVRVPFDHPRFREGVPVSRFGKINMAAMVTELTELDERNTMILGHVRACLFENRRILILTDRREHCFWFAQQFKEDVCGLYIGGMSEPELAVSASKKVVIATFSMAAEGLDIPILDTVVLATPKSDVVQAVGRILRETPGKKNAPRIIDIIDHWSVFFSMFRKRLAIYTSAGFCTADDEPASPFTQGKCLLELEE